MKARAFAASVPLCLIVLLGTALRLWNLGGECAWFDEVLSLQHLDAPSLAAFWRLLAQSDPPAALAPGYFTFEYLWGRLFGPSLLSLRMLSLCCGCACMPLLYSLGRRLHGRKAGSIAALCLALSMPNIYYAQEVRMYAFISLLCLLSAWSLLRILEGGRKGLYAVHGLANLLLLFSNVFTALFLLSEAAFLFLFHRKRKSVLISWMLLQGVFFTLFGLMYARFAVNSAFWMPQPTWRELINAFVVLAGGRYSNENPAPYLPLGLTLDWILAALMAGSAACGIRVRSESLEGSRCFLLGWLLIPPTALFLLAVAWKPCFLYRYVLYASFPLYLLAGAGLAQMRPARAARLLIALVLLYAYQCTPRFTTPFRPDYRSAWQVTTPMCGNDAPMLILKDPLNTLPMFFVPHAAPRALQSAHGQKDLEESSLQLISQYGCARVLLWRWDRLAEYESFLSSRGIRHKRVTLGGMPPLHVYAIEK